MNSQDFLLEIGCEELPHGVEKLATSLADNLSEEINKQHLSFEKIYSFSTPRRIAVWIKNLDEKQTPRTIERQGPNVKSAYDKDGTPTIACLGFARSCGVQADQLQTRKTPKGEFIFCQVEQPGQATEALLPTLIHNAIKSLPIAKPMRWGNHDISFVRPVHWIACMLGKKVINTEILGQQANKLTYGHRYHYPKALTINIPDNYATLLASQGYVIANFKVRRKNIRGQLQQIKPENGQVIIDENLLSEVTNLVEWPVALCGKFKAEFLNLPPEILITTMKVHQRCFPIENINGKLLPYFALISNVDSTDKKNIISGNERVINARLSDAAFFFQNDLKQPLSARLKKLETLVFQHELGNMFEKSQRIASLSTHIANELALDRKLAQRAGILSKCDLVTEMVYEFPNLQGVMGKYYSQYDGEPLAVSDAIENQYLPRFSGDRLPKQLIATSVALADRLDTLIGIIGINKLPSGDKDPFGLRRAALGILRLLIEKALDLDLIALLQQAQNQFTVNLPNNEVISETFDFIYERLRAWYHEKGVTTETFNAVAANRNSSPVDFDRRIQAVRHFLNLPEAQSLSAAYKRVQNILKKQKWQSSATTVNESLFEADAEKDLAKHLTEKQENIRNLYKHQEYTTLLTELAKLKKPIDQFFNDVMVMVDDPKVRDNRLSLLASLQQLFIQVADISLLS